MKQTKSKIHIRKNKKQTKKQFKHIKKQPKLNNKLPLKHNKSKSKSKVKSQSGGDNDFDIMPYLKPYGILDPEGKYPNPLTGYPYSDTYFESSIGRGMPADSKGIWSKMPVYDDRKVFFNKLHKNNVILFISKTGSGKTVLAPKFLLHYFDYNVQIAITIPKRSIVESSAKYSAKLLDVNIGEHVGYVHGGDKNHYNSKYSNLIYMTEGILLAQMTGSDPDLSKYSGVIIDEAHERSTNVDILLMLMKKLVMRRPDFKLIIMSATVSEKVFKDYYDVPGIQFDIFEPIFQETLYEIKDQFSQGHIMKTNSTAELTKKMKEIVSKTKGGHVIAFLSSKSEADSVCRDLKKELEGSDQKPVCVNFYSGHSKEDGKLVRAANDGVLHDMGHGRLIVTATNAIESSFTLKGAEYVVDNGMEYRVMFDPVRVANVRGKVYSTQAQIKQRCGRTGRTNSGYCVRIYSKSQYNHFDEFPEPNIVTENFTSQLLDIVGMKITGNLTNGLALIQEMISPPKAPYLKHAIHNLYFLGLMYKDGYLTDTGRAVRKFNKIEPELALMVLASTAFRCTYEVVIIAAMMSVGSLDSWVSEPDERNKFRTKAQYVDDLRRWSNEFYNYGDHFVMLAIYMEYYGAKSKNKWCREHGVNQGNMSLLETKYSNGRPITFGLIDDIYRTLEGLTYYPKIFDEPEPEPMTDIKSGYRSLTQINDGKYSKSQYGSGRKISQFGGGLKRKNQSHTNRRVQTGGRAKKAEKQPKKVDKQKLERDNKEEFAKNVFKKYYLPVDGVLPRKPVVSYLEDEILCCIYYAFHRNTGIYLGGGGKKYITKLSPVPGSMKNSIFDTIPELETPEIVVYHVLDISENEFGKDSSGYQTICVMDEDLMMEFI
jgi:pre-mRNA-splicing factor ATP-dependent RNA helicase DHX15/PRP43